MNVHKNARLTPRGRAVIVRRVLEEGQTPQVVATACGVCERTVRKWVARFRAVVESLNGRFSHHDGGVDDNIGRLGGVLNQADVVLCPIDCVSHGACLKAKAFCKQTAKPFVPLRSAGLSSFVAGLHEAVGRGNQSFG